LKLKENLFLYLERRVTRELDMEWTDFENAATYEHARNFVEEKYRSRSKVHISSLVLPFDFVFYVIEYT
jgi:hypothetical protein